MAHSTSSAEPEKLFSYADAGVHVNEVLSSTASNLSRQLQHFESHCKESDYRVPSAYLGDILRDYTRQNKPVDELVRRIGRQFMMADSGWKTGLYLWGTAKNTWTLPNWAKIILYVMSFQPFLQIPIWLAKVILLVPWLKPGQTLTSSAIAGAEVSSVTDTISSEYSSWIGILDLEQEFERRNQALQQRLDALKNDADELWERRRQLEEELGRLGNKLLPVWPLAWGDRDPGLDAPWRTRADELEGEIALIDARLGQVAREYQNTKQAQEQLRLSYQKAKAQREVKIEYDKGKIFVTALGQRCEFKSATYKGDSGHVYYGSLRPDADTIQQELEKLGLPSEDARVLAAVSGHEGGFDTIQTYDRAKFTWGFIQFAGTGGLHNVMTNIKAQAPNEFQEYFGIYGIDVADGKVIVHKDGQVLSGESALNELHDNPELWGGFLRASQDPTIQTLQVKTAYDYYYQPIMNKPVSLGGQTYTLGELFKDDDYGRAMLFDRAVQRGVGGAHKLFTQAIAQSGADSPDDLQAILNAAKALEPSYAGRWNDINRSFPT